MKFPAGARCVTIRRCRAPHGARGLKLEWERRAIREFFGRAPHGARGLKLDAKERYDLRALSRPARGAWIEIISRRWSGSAATVAPRTGRVD